MKNPDLIFNWARDYIQKEQSNLGQCEEKSFKEVFARFKLSYGYEGTYKDVLRELKRNGFINRITK